MLCFLQSKQQFGFIGIMRDPITSDTSFKWLDGSVVPLEITEEDYEVDFENWYSSGGEPQAASSGQHCVTIVHNRDGRGGNNGNCPAARWYNPNYNRLVDCIDGAWDLARCTAKTDRFGCDLSPG